MLQRVQSLWLLFASAFTAVTFRFPFFSGKPQAGQAGRNANPIDPLTGYEALDADSNIWLLILTVLTGLVAFVTIFLYNNRKLQQKLCYLGIFLAIVLYVLYFLEMQRFLQGNVAIWAVFYFAILVCYILALRGIWRDEKLIRSMDRFR
ncbi:MAG TPA: DUF4293 domain-containing protein [Chitinophagaceae bacterium]|jgi:glucan phosphoethanolaminetransferase (alkaline phosphatase superfamily)|nr:DUF4293 domain-containing protein [Chitinophagaceae bacterium]